MRFGELTSLIESADHAIFKGKELTYRHAGACTFGFLNGVCFSSGNILHGITFDILQDVFMAVGLDGIQRELGKNGISTDRPLRGSDIAPIRKILNDGTQSYYMKMFPTGRVWKSEKLVVFWPDKNEVSKAQAEAACRACGINPNSATFGFSDDKDNEHNWKYSDIDGSGKRSEYVFVPPAHALGVSMKTPAKPGFGSLSKKRKMPPLTSE